MSQQSHQDIVAALKAAELPPQDALKPRRLVMVYSETCPHCHNAAPNFLKACEMLNQYFDINAGTLNAKVMYNPPDQATGNSLQHIAENVAHRGYPSFYTTDDMGILQPLITNYKIMNPGLWMKKATEVCKPNAFHSFLLQRYYCADQDKNGLAGGRQPLPRDPMTRPAVASPAAARPAAARPAPAAQQRPQPVARAAAAPAAEMEAKEEDEAWVVLREMPVVQAANVNRMFAQAEGKEPDYGSNTITADGKRLPRKGKPASSGASKSEETDAAMQAAYSNENDARPVQPSGDKPIVEKHEGVGLQLMECGEDLPESARAAAAARADANDIGICRAVTLEDSRPLGTLRLKYAADRGVLHIEQVHLVEGADYEASSDRIMALLAKYYSGKLPEATRVQLPVEIVVEGFVKALKKYGFRYKKESSTVEATLEDMQKALAQ